MIQTVKNVVIRRSARDDVAFIRNVNRRCLPENYLDSFYLNHMNQWPQLQNVAVHTDDFIVGYVVGSVSKPSDLFSNVDIAAVKEPQRFSSDIGFINSIAVDYEHRGKHIASNMMQNFERRAMLVHDVDSVALHCRTANRSALSMYLKLHYEVVLKLPGFYADGGDGCLMAKFGLKSHFN